ncbi:MAG TPA: hypothetical protein VLJ11_14185 [Bryobacteraceae bacterium]|nr:hypothetical protein [Bryobacteraceae bacterium]
MDSAGDWHAERVGRNGLVAGGLPPEHKIGITRLMTIGAFYLL